MTKSQREHYGKMVLERCGQTQMQPMIAMHSDAGKSWLSKKYDDKFIDIDDVMNKPSKWIWDDVGDALLAGNSPWKFVVLGSGMGKTFMLGLAHNPKYVDIDDVMDEILRDESDDVRKRILEDNERSDEVDSIIRANIHRVVDHNKVLFVHNYNEVPDGGEVVAAASYPRTDVPIVGKGDGWHSHDRHLHDLNINTNYTNTDLVLSGGELRHWAYEKLGIEPFSHRGENEVRYGGQRVIRWTPGLTHSCEAGGWPIFEDLKVMELRKKFKTEYWQKELKGKVLLVHTPEEIVRLDGLALGQIAYMGALKKKPAELNRSTNLRSRAVKGLETRKAYTRDGVVRMALNMFNYWKKTTQGQDAWFWLFKYEKLKQGIFKCFNEQTEIYLNSSFSEWMLYQEEHYEDIMFQNYHMPDWLYKLKRYRPGTWDLSLGPVNDCAQVLNLYDKQTYGWLLQMCRSKYNFTRKTYLKGMKLLSGMIKSFNNDWREDWMRWVDLTYLCPFTRALDKQEQREDVMSWLCSKDSSKHYVDGSERKFLDEFEKSVEELLSEKAQSYDYGLEQFVSMPNLWAVSGSSRSPLEPGSVIVDGEQVKLRNSKRAVAYFNSTDKIMEYLRSDTAENHVFLKQEEVVRIRTIVNSSLNMYILMTYLDKAVYSMIASDKQQHSPIFPHFNYFKDKVDQARRIGSWVNMPIDQKGFERQTSMEMIDIILKVIRSRLPVELTPELDQVSKLIHNSTLHFKVDGEVLIDGERVTNGVSSGWKWTALFNTIVNLAEWYTCARLCGVEYRNLCALGDDTRVQVRTYDEARRCLKWYSDAKIEINTKVAIVSHTCDEFLRVVTEPGRQGGYPVRVIPSICYRKPGAIQPSQPRDEIEVIIGNWYKLMSRANVDVERYMIDDINNSLGRYGIRSDAVEFIYTPTAQGGFGCLPFNAKGKGLFIDRIKKVNTAGLSSRLSKIRDLNQRRVGLRGAPAVEVDRDWLSSFFSENINEKIVGYKVERKIVVGDDDYMTPGARFKLTHFMYELIRSINKHDKYLPYRKGSFVPVSRLHGSGFFNNTYDALRPEDRHMLFENPDVYERIRRQLGLKFADTVAKEGMRWNDMKQHVYDVDFVNNLAAQVWCYWIDKRLNTSASYVAINKWISDNLLYFVDQLDFKVYA